MITLSETNRQELAVAYVRALITQLERATAPVIVAALTMRIDAALGIDPSAKREATPANGVAPARSLPVHIPAGNTPAQAPAQASPVQASGSPTTSEGPKPEVRFVKGALKQALTDLLREKGPLPMREIVDGMQAKGFWQGKTRTEAGQLARQAMYKVAVNENGQWRLRT